MIYSFLFDSTLVSPFHHALHIINQKRRYTKCLIYLIFSIRFRAIDADTKTLVPIILIAIMTEEILVTAEVMNITMTEETIVITVVANVTMTEETIVIIVVANVAMTEETIIITVVLNVAITEETIVIIDVMTTEMTTTVTADNKKLYFLHT